MADNNISIKTKEHKLYKLTDLTPIPIEFSEETRRFIERPYYKSDGEYLVLGVFDDEPRFKKFRFHLEAYATTLTRVPDSYNNGQAYLVEGQRVSRPLDFRFNNLEAWLASLEDCPVVDKTGYGEDSRAFPLTDTNILRLIYTIKLENVLFNSEVAMLKFKLEYMHLIAACKRAIFHADFKANPREYVATLPQDFVDHPIRPLANFQQFAVQYTQAGKGTALFLEQGLGKTAISIANICTSARKARRKDPTRMLKVLIIGPNAVRLNWLEEFKRFSTLDCGATVMRGNQTERFKKLLFAMKGKPNWAFSAVICGIDSAANDIEALCSVRWDEVYIDESHLLKSSKTKRWKMLRLLRDFAEVINILTGSPYGNSIQDMYTQLEMIGHGQSGFGSEASFKKFHGRYEHGVTQEGRKFERLVGHNNVPFLKERLARLALILTKDEVGIDLPDKVYSILEVDMTTDKSFLGGKSQKDVYSDLSSKLMSEIDLGGDNLSSIEVNHMLTKLLRLAQVTSGHVGLSRSVDPDTGEITPESINYLHANPLDNPKVDIIFQDFLQQPKTSKAIIWAHFRADHDLLAKAAEAHGIQYVMYRGGTPDKVREAAVSAFNEDPNVRLMIANPSSAGTGINLMGYNYKDPPEDHLDTNCDTMYFFSQSWSYLTRTQAESRSHRRGTRSPLRIIDVLVPDTIDIQIHDAVSSKKKSAMSIQDIREVLESLR